MNWGGDWVSSCGKFFESSYRVYYFETILCYDCCNQSFAAGRFPSLLQTKLSLFQLNLGRLALARDAGDAGASRCLILPSARRLPQTRRGQLCPSPGCSRCFYTYTLG